MSRSLQTSPSTVSITFVGPDGAAVVVVAVVLVGVVAGFAGAGGGWVQAATSTAWVDRVPLVAGSFGKVTRKYLCPGPFSTLVEIALVTLRPSGEVTTA